jgi:hypothetical protein
MGIQGKGNSIVCGKVMVSSNIEDMNKVLKVFREVWTLQNALPEEERALQEKLAEYGAKNAQAASAGTVQEGETIDEGSSSGGEEEMDLSMLDIEEGEGEDAMPKFILRSRRADAS